MNTRLENEASLASTKFEFEGTSVEPGKIVVVAVALAVETGEVVVWTAVADECVNDNKTNKQALKEIILLAPAVATLVVVCVVANGVAEPN
jgi:hypothetical protein